MSTTDTAIAAPVETAPAMPRVSALVVAHNEEAQLADCLARLNFADEIVVVLARPPARPPGRHSGAFPGHSAEGRGGAKGPPPQPRHPPLPWRMDRRDRRR